MIRYFTTEKDLSDVATAIKNKKGLTPEQKLKFPNGFITAINEIDTGYTGGDIHRDVTGSVYGKMTGDFTYMADNTRLEKQTNSADGDIVYFVQDGEPMYGYAWGIPANLPGDFTYDSSYTKITGLTEAGQAKTALTVPWGISTLGAQSLCKKNAWGSNPAVTPHYESIVLPETLVSIKANVFNYSPLKSVTIPHSMTSIGMYAFHYAIYLESITIPDTVTEIDDAAFTDCWRLHSITLPASLKTIGSQAFFQEEPNSDDAPDDPGLFSIDIPNGVETIGHEAFSTNMFLTSVHIPASVTEIGDDAFFKISANAEITIDRPESEVKGDNPVLQGWPWGANKDTQTWIFRS